MTEETGIPAGFRPAGVLHEKVWGLVGIPLEFPGLPSHMEAAARKYGRQKGS